MRLLRGGFDETHGWNFRFTDYLVNDVPAYAILSHVWLRPGSKEMTYEDINKSTGYGKIGFEKLKFLAQQAAKDGLEHFWIDTCCIDKSNNTELTEAINSMFRWYQRATVCYVYLPDVRNSQSVDVHFKQSQWFKRGWTLQELIAPSSVKFFAANSDFIGNKASLEESVEETTGIPQLVLRGQPLSEVSTSQRLSWMRGRETTRKEDMAYCLLGTFGIYMPLIYGEGDNAFVRLREAIDKQRKRKNNSMASDSRISRTEVEISTRSWPYHDFVVLSDSGGSLENLGNSSISTLTENRQNAQIGAATSSHTGQSKGAYIPNISTSKDYQSLWTLDRPPTPKYSWEDYNCNGALTRQRSATRCEWCSWKDDHPSIDTIRWQDLDENRLISSDFIGRYFHHVYVDSFGYKRASAFRCYICRSGAPISDPSVLFHHLEACHKGDHIFGMKQIATGHSRFK